MILLNVLCNMFFEVYSTTAFIIFFTCLLMLFINCKLKYNADLKVVFNILICLPIAYISAIFSLSFITNHDVYCGKPTKITIKNIFSQISETDGTKITKVKGCIIEYESNISKIPNNINRIEEPFTYMAYTSSDYLCNLKVGKKVQVKFDYDLTPTDVYHGYIGGSYKNRFGLSVPWGMNTPVLSPVNNN